MIGDTHERGLPREKVAPLATAEGEVCDVTWHIWTNM